MDSYYISNTIDDEILKCGNVVIIVIRHKGVQQIIQVVDPNLIILFLWVRDKYFSFGKDIEEVEKQRVEIYFTKVGY